MQMDKTALALIALVLAHFAITIAHGSAHTAAGVDLGPFGLTFVLLVIVIGPLAGLVWMWANRRAGALLVGMTMLGACVFGLVNHFIIPGPDRIDAVALSSRAAFATTAVLLLITEAAGAALGIAYGRRSARRVS
jgi:hypothetical protein